MFDIVLIPGLTIGLKRSDASKSSISLGTLSLAAYLRSQGINAAIFNPDDVVPHKHDINYIPYERIAQDLTRYDASVYGFYVSVRILHHVLRIAACLKLLNPKATVVVGGPHATAIGEKLLGRFAQIDVVFHGEAEKSLCEYMNRFLHGMDTVNILGTTVRTSKGVHRNPDWPLITDLNSLPMPAYDLVLGADPALDVLPLDVGRGCPYSCTFCSTTWFWKRAYRMKSPDRILQEMHQMAEKYGINKFFFMHDCFTADLATIDNICTIFKRSEHKYRWGCAARIEHLDMPMLEKLRSAGCYHIEVGVEAASVITQRHIRKPIKLPPSFQSLSHLIRDAHNIGFSFVLYFMCGFPWETKSDFEATLTLIEESALSYNGNGFFRLSVLEYFPGASQWENYNNLVFDPHNIGDNKLYGYLDTFLDVGINEPSIFPELYSTPNQHGIPTDYFTATSNIFNTFMRILLTEFHYSYRVLSTALATNAHCLCNHWIAYCNSDDNIHLNDISIIENIPGFFALLASNKETQLPQWIFDLLTYEQAVSLSRQEYISHRTEQYITDLPVRKKGVRILRLNCDVRVLIRQIETTGTLPTRIRRKILCLLIVPKAVDQIDVFEATDIIAKLVDSCDGESTIANLRKKIGLDTTQKEMHEILDITYDIGAIHFKRINKQSRP